MNVKQRGSHREEQYNSSWKWLFRAQISSGAHTGFFEPKKGTMALH